MRALVTILFVNFVAATQKRLLLNLNIIFIIWFNPYCLILAKLRRINQVKKEEKCNQSTTDQLSFGVTKENPVRWTLQY